MTYKGKYKVGDRVMVASLWSNNYPLGMVGTVDEIYGMIGNDPIIWFKPDDSSVSREAYYEKSFDLALEGEFDAKAREYIKKELRNG